MLDHKRHKQATPTYTNWTSPNFKSFMPQKKGGKILKIVQKMSENICKLYTGFSPVFRMDKYFYSFIG